MTYRCKHYPDNIRSFKTNYKTIQRDVDVLITELLSDVKLKTI